MDFKEKYKFADFTLTNYRKLLTIAKENFRFVSYTDELSADYKNILLRHDIDLSIPNALRMAEIEKELKINATYFLQVHSEFYNPFDKENFTAIQQIVKMGHILGLHFDTHFWEVSSEEQLEKCLTIDKHTLETYFNTPIKTFSFHNTNKTVLSYENYFYAGLINVYANFFKTKVGYCADSTGYWRFERLEDRLIEANDTNLQILIHPGMWHNEVLPPRRRVFKVIDERASYLKRYWDETLKKFGARNIDWEEVL